MKIDLLCPILPDGLYEQLARAAPNAPALREWEQLAERSRLLHRLNCLDSLQSYKQILSLPFLPSRLDPVDWTPKLAEISNEYLAGLCRKYPEYFPGFLSSVPTDDPHAAVLEAERCIRDLKACGIMLQADERVQFNEPLYKCLFELLQKLDCVVCLIDGGMDADLDPVLDDASSLLLRKRLGAAYPQLRVLMKRTSSDQNSASHEAVAPVLSQVTPAELSAASERLFFATGCAFTLDTSLKPIEKAISMVEALSLGEARTAALYADNAIETLKLHDAVI